MLSSDHPRSAPLLRRAGFSFLLGFAIFFLGSLLEMALRRNGINEMWQFLDNIASGIVTGLLIFLYERQRHRNVVRNLQMIAAMNHHVRNALQSIMFVPYSPTQAEQVKLIQNSVDRIQWALREVLPAAIDDRGGDRTADDGIRPSCYSEK